ncbi:AAA domain-containing protein [Prevotella sp. P2-180]|uniref:AAA domain-containing protein n=1 Tax=Prevotella sp. P2-180 TaxID=2024224 RepID=UPI000B964491|nr:AAA domain-containing protein [Prevotella sp. P2-180]MDD6863560.1 AAA domain-containing protein [Prevotella sp.]OYP63566.1 helicase [Prevotella sp. P2-180]
MTESPILALQQQRILLEIEYNVDKEEHKKQMEAKGLERLAKRGDVWLNVRFGRSYYNSLNQLSVEILRTQDNEIEHNFEFGRPVYIIFTEKPSNKNEKRTKSINGTVSYVDGDRMVVVVPDGTDTVGMQTASSLYVQLGFDETTYRLMFEALDRTISARGRLGYLRDLFYSNHKAETFTFAPLSFPFLNVSQERAVNEVLRAKDVAVVHGPPGTGKTTTLVEAIYETLRRENQVLVCAQSNMAVDWISEKLVDRGINVLRIGNPTKVNDKMLSFTYERRFESHPDYPQLWAIRKAIRQLRANRKRGDNSFHQKMERLKEREIELELRIRNKLFGEARVIASTLVGSANRLLDGMKFGTLFIDEAAQALEAACWIPIRRATRVILAGDHCQLPPTIKSIAAMKGGLDKTLMQRIVECKPEAVTLLKMQYRMNEDIMRFSSDWFYNGQVEAAPMVKYRGILDLDKAIEWKDTSGNAYHEEFVGDNFGRINKEEAQLTLLSLAEYFVRIGRQRIIDERIDVGIISPYRAQVQYLRHLIKKTDFYKPFRKIISVNTVDGFQGQERDIIVISMVRSNEEGQIGFLRDLRRMNVAITRARMKLIILGDSATLIRHPFYRRLKEYIDSLSETY